ncbi:MAG: ATP-dependent DNA helicase, partial [Elusimicrobia bacterium]|nr:ATP-dependent DNA helicase [Elusimicrobiota bacterium]
ARSGWEPRPPQEAMAGAVWQSLERGGDLVVEAGTGVGKSLAYLLPAALWAATRDRRVIVSTHTRALQEQLLNHELPTAARAMEALGLPLRYAMLMGADNYLCVQRLARLRARPDSVSETGKETLERLDAWTRDAQSGHRSALPELIPQNIWDRVARDTDVCMGPGGPYWDRCLWRRDRERADRAHILVVNHALLLSGARLPPSDAMILDEAHNLEDAASARYGVTAGLHRAVELTEEVKVSAMLYADEALAERAALAASELGSFFVELARENGLKEPDEENQGKLLESTPDAPPAALLALDKALAEAAAAAEGRPDETEMRMLHARVAQFGHDLMAVLKPDSSATARWVAWPRTGPELRAAPLDVGRRLAEGLFSRGIPAILTSATLSTGDGLKDFKARVGLPEARELVLDSPYDYASQAAFWAVEGLPDPKDEEAHAAAITQACADIVARVPGGVFLLFSSWRLLRKVHGLLRRKIPDRPVWAQGASGHDALVREFENAGDAVLLGVDTFWQGIDVPGEALSCVVLVKLPFPNVSSALEEARRRWLEENGRDYFKDWSLPRAVMKFRQGFGRLIRTGTDRGAVVCLDSRVLKKGYGKVFLRSLPPCKKINGLDELGAFFSPAAGAAGPSSGEGSPRPSLPEA